MLSKQNHDLNANWKSRTQRSEFVEKFINLYGIGSLLNLGSGGKRELRTDEKVLQVDVDFQGDVDIELNLDNIDQLPFDDRAFDCVCAMDVLEHLENFHLIVEEMIRCADRFVIVSLPNSAAEIPRIIIDGDKLKKDSYQGYFSKYYGLPIKKELDRHRYWLYVQDIIRFFETIGQKYQIDVSYVLPDFSLKLKVIRAIIGKRLFYTFFLNHICLVLSKEAER